MNADRIDEPVMNLSIWVDTEIVRKMTSLNKDEGVD